VGQNRDIDATTNGMAGNLLLGGILGTAASGAFERFYDQGRRYSPMTRLSQWVDTLPGFRQANQWLRRQGPPPAWRQQPLPQTLTFQRPAAQVEAETLATHMGSFQEWAREVLPSEVAMPDDPKTKEVLKRFSQSVDAHLASANAQPALLDGLAQVRAAVGAEDFKRIKPAAAMLDGLQKRLTVGLQEQYIHPYRQLHRLFRTHGLQPIGSLLFGMGYLLRRVLGGMAGSSALPGKGGMGGWLAPFIAGTVIFGPAVEAWKQAEPGERTRGFWQGLLGKGLGNWVGWELGLLWLNQTQAVTKLLNGIRPGLAVAPTLFGLSTFGRVLTEALAIFVVAPWFERAGQLLAKGVLGTARQDPLKQQLQAGYHPLVRHAFIEETPVVSGPRSMAAPPSAANRQQPANKEGSLQLSDAELSQLMTPVFRNTGTV
jgi:hypothetical protein